MFSIVRELIIWKAMTCRDGISKDKNLHVLIYRYIEMVMPALAGRGQTFD